MQPAHNGAQPGRKDEAVTILGSYSAGHSSSGVPGGEDSPLQNDVSACTPNGEGRSPDQLNLDVRHPIPIDIAL